MGDFEAAHGLHSQLNCLGWRWADFSFFFLPAPPMIHFQFESIFHFDPFPKIQFLFNKSPIPCQEIFISMFLILVRMSPIDQPGEEGKYCTVPSG
jgi:hypothetical protein